MNKDQSIKYDNRGNLKLLMHKTSLQCLPLAWRFLLFIILVTQVFSLKSCNQHQLSKRVNFDFNINTIQSSSGKTIKSSFSINQTLNMITTRIGRVDDIDQIVTCTNRAFMADAFFKKPEFHLRFTQEDVVRMMAETNAVFIVATCKNNAESETFKMKSIVDSKDSNNEVMGSLYLTWKVVNESPLLKIEGKFSAVSVPSKYANQGIGKLLVKAAENYLCQEVFNKNYEPKGSSTSLSSSSCTFKEKDDNNNISILTTTPTSSSSLPLQQSSASSSSSLPLSSHHHHHISLEMGVINLRTDLFPWYEKQGYQVIGDIRPNDDEITRIVLKELQDQVYCILMRKQLLG